MHRTLRDEALKMLDDRGAILDIARDVSKVMMDAGVEGAVVGGVAVVLHGYVRTTMDVDVWVDEALPDLKKVLEAAGYEFHRGKREFRKSGVPVHLVTSEQTRMKPVETVEIEGVRTVGLADLINMKLASGLKNPLRAIDLADVIGLIRRRRLSPTFAGQLLKPVRVEFRKLARAVSKEQRG